MLAPVIPAATPFSMAAEPFKSEPEAELNEGRRGCDWRGRIGEPCSARGCDIDRGISIGKIADESRSGEPGVEDIERGDEIG